MADRSALDERGPQLASGLACERDADPTQPEREAVLDAEDVGQDAGRHLLAAALGVPDDSLTSALVRALNTLRAAGVTPAAAVSVEWLPALHVAWQWGVGVAERDRLLAIAGLGTVPAAAMDLMADWCVTKPAPEVFEAGLLILRSRLRRLPDEERAWLTARVIGTCDTVANAAGGWTGFRRVSADEGGVLQATRIELRVRVE